MREEFLRDEGKGISKALMAFKGISGLFEAEWSEPERRVVVDEIRDVMGYSSRAVSLRATPNNLESIIHIPVK